ncbi:MAG TPA: hypothetical protein VGQ62_11990, partial [Chloroflexota bacterium]|nr:hypothetical protein [Chloroflexota bacterium]
LQADDVGIITSENCGGARGSQKICGADFDFRLGVWRNDALVIGELALDQLNFEQKREVLEVLQAEFTLEKDGQLRILLVLPTSESSRFYTNVRHASA